MIDNFEIEFVFIITDFKEKNNLNITLNIDQKKSEIIKFILQHN